jgi:DnaJ-class molecular chaperone
MTKYGKRYDTVVTYLKKVRGIGVCPTCKGASRLPTKEWCNDCQATGRLDVYERSISNVKEESTR